MEEEIQIKRKRGRPPKPESEKARPTRKRGRKPIKRQRGRPRKHPLEPVTEVRAERSVIETQAKPESVEPVYDNPRSFEIDHLLIDEQIFYTHQIAEQLKEEERKIKPVISELDRMILGEVREVISKPLADNSISISLKKGNSNSS